MATVNIRQLRDTRKLKAWLRAGKTVELRDRNQLIGRIVPARPRKRRAVQYPDFAARAKKIFGDRILPGADIVIEERGRY
jgi:antitoxin (DNA-binding transcriptional repressor) of toxin-antitoxin stability system